MSTHAPIRSSAIDTQPFLAAIAEQAGLPSLTLNDQNVCCLSAPGEIDIQIEADAESGQVLLLAPLGPLGEDASGGASRSLLAANFLFQGTRGESLSLDPDSRIVFLCAALELASVDTDFAVNWFIRFADTARHWRSRWQSQPTEVSNRVPLPISVLRG